MYSPKVTAKKVAEVEKSFSINLTEHSLAEVDDWNHRLSKLVHPDSTDKTPQLIRPMNDEEKAFVVNELMMIRINYPYWATRYAFIRDHKGGETRIKFWESQQFMLDTIGALEEQNKPILLLNLKARQIGSSTISESILTHKVITTQGITSMLAADEPGQSEFLFNMMERIYDHLPFWMKPHRKYQVKGTQMFFDELDSNILVDSGNKRVGGLGQGKAIHCGHLSELSTWENPEQVTEDLFPAIMSAVSPNTFFILESTAKGRVNHFRDWWIAAKKKRFHGFTPIFIPWYAIKEKYQADPIPDWLPTTRSLEMAKALLVTHNVSLTKKQLYWWEKTYESYKEENRLNAFFAEYCADDEEAFQLSGRSVFPIEVVQDLRRKAMTRCFTPYQFEEKGLIGA
jgi:hypothetical protein